MGEQIYDVISVYGFVLWLKTLADVSGPRA